ncbi:MAG: DUF4430 domain-containing protein [Lachnospiraceae bacterium]|nr:DUF4430 domain-containing protein [Lachnospiraceae bacterium]
MKKLIKFLSFSLVLLFGSISAFSGKSYSSAAVLPQAELKQEVNTLINGILDYCLNENKSDSLQDYIDNVLAENVGGSAEWYIQALLSYEDSFSDNPAGRPMGFEPLNYEKYKTSLFNYLETNDFKSAVTREKCAMVLMKLHNHGYANEADIEMAHKVLDESCGKLGVMSYIYGLHLANEIFSAHSETDASFDINPDSIISELKALQKDDGGWAINGQYGDVDVTAMALQALAPHKDNYPEMIGAAIAFLSSHQQPTGDFASYGSNNAESTAQTIQALSLLEIDICNDSRFIKNTNTALDGLRLYLLPDGSFCHLSGSPTNATATVQSLYALADYYKLLSKIPEAAAPETAAPETAEPDESKEPGKNEPVTPSQKNEPVTPSPRDHETERNEPTTPSPRDQKLSKGSYKPVAIIIIAVLFVVSCIVILIKNTNPLHKKKRLQAVIFAAVLAAAAIIIVLFTDFSTKDSYYKAEADISAVADTVTMSIRCDNILKTDNPGTYTKNEDKGCILETTSFEFFEGETVYQLLIEAARAGKITVYHTGGEEMAYIVAINNLKEFDYGDLSGWIYTVNGVQARVGCGSYILSAGDVVEWHYTLDLGHDIP